MTKNLLHVLGKLLSIVVALAFVGVFIFLAARSFPTSPAAGNSAYPAPIDIHLTPTLLPPDVLCDQWFSFRKALPEDKRKLIEEDYINCVNARKTPSPLGIEKPIPNTPSSGEYSSPFFRRGAGSGTIIETNFSPLNSNYRIKNQWVADLAGLHFIVYAGGRLSDSANGDALLNDLSWPGVVVVSVSDSTGKTLLDKGGIFWTPNNSGPIRVVDANNTNLTLVANDGSVYIFDVGTHTFLTTKPTSIFSRQTGTGTLAETGESQYHLDDFVFENQWTYSVKGTETLTVLAGEKRIHPQTGVFVVIISPSVNSSKILEGTEYITNLEDGALRIINVKGQKITLVSDSGLVYDFDLTSRQFISIPSGSSAISVIPIISVSTTPGEEFLSITNTPTTTPTPHLTRTPLPTYNPYP